MLDVTYTLSLAEVDWAGLKADLQRDNFDNGRTPAQLRQSFENSAVVCLAYVAGQAVGTVRVLSDGVCNAYVVDVWTLSRYRRQGIATGMMQRVLEKLPGQHVYLFTDEAEEFYNALGFSRQGTGLAKVVGEWLVNDSLPTKSGE